LKNIVTIKGKENGLEITLSEKETYPVLREELIRKLKQNQNFFRDSKTKVVIRGKELPEPSGRDKAGICHGLRHKRRYVQ
jgi:septum site-determining protein MinC